MNILLLKKLWFWVTNRSLDILVWEKRIINFIPLRQECLSYILLVSLLGFTACKKEETPPIISNSDGFQNGVLISNEGNFRSGNASVTFYNPSTKEVQEKIFEASNNQPLGDILQSINFIDDKAFLVVNNSNKIEVVNTSDFKLLETIDNLIAPRYLLPINPTTAYISDIYADEITVLDLNTMQPKNTIPFSGWSERMVQVGSEIFVTKPSDIRRTLSNHIYIINTQTNVVSDSIEVGFDPISMIKDRNDKLWVICNGEESKDKVGGLYKINPSTKMIESSLLFPDFSKSLSPQLATNANKDQLYFLRKDVYKLSITDTNGPTIPFIEAEGRDLYGLGIHPTTNEVYLGDSGNFTQRGTVTIHNQEGIELSSFKAGVGINGFYFN